MLEELMISSRQNFDSAHLVDPDAELLRLALERVQSLGLASKISSSLGTAETLLSSVADGTDAILAIHLIYLLGKGRLARIISALPLETPLFIVFDEQESVFQELWRRTAPKYHQRVVDAHRILSELPVTHFRVAKSEFDSQLRTPLALRAELRDAVLSMLCYSEISQFDDSMRKWIHEVIEKRTAAGKVICDCACYEVTRIAP